LVPRDDARPPDPGDAGATSDGQDQRVQTAKPVSVRRSQRRVPRRAALLAAGAATPLALLLTAPAQAASTSSTTVKDVAEAWYAASPIDVCTTPLGCPPQQVPTSPYPAGSLHVGVAGGRETARSYVQPDLSQLPPGATLVRGVMTLHVDTSGTDGTLSPASAKILACLVTAPIPDGTQGSTSKPPAVDCTTSAKPTYGAKAQVFTLDLTTFLRAWTAGKPQLGIALVPNETEVGQTDAWHVTIEGRKQAGAKPATSTISYRPAPPVDLGPTSVTPPPAPVPQPVAPAPAPELPPPTTTLGSGPAPAPVVAPTQPPAAPVGQQPVAFSRPVEYPVAFVAPLALLAGVVFFARLFTRDATPKRRWT
jgi:hypothetical protein